MQLIKISAAIIVGLITSAYASGADTGQLPLEEATTTTAPALATAVVPPDGAAEECAEAGRTIVKRVIINGKTPAELLAEGMLEPFQVLIKIPATINNRIAVTVDAIQLVGYVLKVPAIPDPRQTVALGYRQTAPGVFEVTAGIAAFEDRFYPRDPREIYLEMYARSTNTVRLRDGTRFSCPFSKGTNLTTPRGGETMKAPAGIYVYEGKIAVRAQNFAVNHGTCLVSPLPIEFGLVGNPFIRAVTFNARPFYQELDGIPACFNAVLLEMSGDKDGLSAKASFVGALHKSAMEVIFDPSIMPTAAASSAAVAEVD